MLKSYLKKEWVTYGLLFLFFMLIFGFFWLFLIGFSVLGLSLFVFRKVDPLKGKGEIKASGVIRSPIHGILISKKENVKHQQFGEQLIELVIMLPHGYEQGVYLPCDSEVGEIIQNQRNDYFRYKRSWKVEQEAQSFPGTTLQLLSRSGLSIGMQFFKCYLGLKEQLWVLQGDRGGLGSRIGHFPFGGTVVVYLPESFQVIPKIGDVLSAGESILAKEAVQYAQ